MPLKKAKKLEFLLAFQILIFGILLRFLPHAPNFAPVGAVSLFAGFYFSRRTALILPLLLMLLSDFFLGFYEVLVMAAVYLSFALTVFLGFLLKKINKLAGVPLGALFASLIFFVLTNFAVWAFTPWYSKTLTGLFQAYLMALPFFKNTLLSNFFYSAIFFGLYELGKLWLRKKLLAGEKAAFFKVVK